LTAQAEFSLLAPCKPHSRVWSYAPEAGIALFLLVIGTAGLVAPSWPRQLVDSCINIHLLFGLLLCSWVVIRFQLCVRVSPCLLPAEVRGLSRQLSRIVYCVLYGVVGLKQGISIVGSLWHGGALDFSLFSESVRQGPDATEFYLHDDFQQFLASGLVPLVIVRVMAFRLWLRVSEKALG
jgi:cytochrome b561